MYYVFVWGRLPEHAFFFASFILSIVPDDQQENKGALNDISISPKRNNNDLILGNGNSSVSGPHGVHVLSASGNHIIAVTNPALALSPALVDPINIKREELDD